MSDITDLLRTLGLAVTIKAAYEIERLRQRVKELESEAATVNDFDIRNLATLEAEIAELRKQQGEPVAFLYSAEGDWQEALLPSEVDKEAFAEFPEFYFPLYKGEQP